MLGSMANKKGKAPKDSYTVYEQGLNKNILIQGKHCKLS